MIFEAAAEPLRNTSDSLFHLSGMEPSRRGRRPSQIDIAAVCSRWRTIAHKTATMWNTIIFDNYLANEAAEEWCARGKSTPLDLVVAFLDCAEEGRWHRVALINRVSHRLRTLKLVGYKLPLNHVASEWTLPAPWLQTYEVLTRFCYCEDHTVSMDATGMFIRAPSSFPALRSLKISPMYFPWRTAPAFDGCCASSVQDLTLSFQDWPRTDLASTFRLLAAFQNMTSLKLENVAICEAGSHATECTAIVGLEPVHLLQLQSLLVTTSYGFDSCFQWLHLLDAPSLRTVNINNSQSWQRELPQIAG
ncbi:hypothetical protein CALVIDRAFT_542614 [Calocera viscosa TUFC12733]|uniref:F-box domain-containing protein n=1 Tax=Calocera viscosa (strain TUFC12733) TaxID=1330018 RepID=A0A167GF96_CALVF|nr:hypothetical protein CALVIDRAFT_542614 [Calocera viscosa TUFC12733]